MIQGMQDATSSSLSFPELDKQGLHGIPQDVAIWRVAIPLEACKPSSAKTNTWKVGGLREDDCLAPLCCVPPADVKRGDTRERYKMKCPHVLGLVSDAIRVSCSLWAQISRNTGLGQTSKAGRTIENSWAPQNPLCNLCRQAKAGLITKTTSSWGFKDL